MKSKLLVVALFVAASAAVAAKAEKAASSIVTPADVKYMQPYGPQGPSFGFVDGEFGKLGHPASMFIKVPAGFDSGWHIHDEDYEAVVLKGQFSEQQQNAQENPLAVGTYFTQTGKKVHRNGCSKDGDCMLFVHFNKGATSIPTDMQGKPLPPPPAAGAAKKM